MTSSTESCSREEILIDHILSRLAVKSLLRFKCVCKNWCDLFNSLSFIKKHCDSPGNRTHPAVCKFGVNYNNEPEPLRSFNFYVLPEKIFTGIVPSPIRGFIVAKELQISDVFMVRLTAYSYQRKDITQKMFAFVGGILLPESVGLFLNGILSFLIFLTITHGQLGQDQTSLTMTISSYGYEYFTIMINMRSILRHTLLFIH